VAFRFYGPLEGYIEKTWVLNDLYELHMPILSVNVLTKDNGDLQDRDKPAKR